jgi:hypothetical protein
MKKLLLLFIFIASLTKQSHAQIITTVAGNDTIGYSGDGGQATNAKLGGTFDVVIAPFTNNIYFTEGSNVIRKIDTAGIITTVAGTGYGIDSTFSCITCYSGDGGPATMARLYNPHGICLDQYENIYFADAGNNRIRKINTLGIIQTIAGNGGSGYSGDGMQATSAMLSFPNDICFDNIGNLYVADYSNNRVRKINTNGIITTIAGNGSSTYLGDGLQATNTGLDLFGVWIDTGGNLLIAANSRILKVNSNGVIHTIAGNGNVGYTGDGGSATNAMLGQFLWVEGDTLGNLLYVVKPICTFKHK